MLLRPRRPAETYDISLSFHSATHSQTIYFADAGRGVRCVSSNGGRTDRSYMSRFSGQSRWHHIAQSTPDRSIAFAAIVHGASARLACYQNNLSLLNVCRKAHKLVSRECNEGDRRRVRQGHAIRQMGHVRIVHCHQLGIGRDG
jgi:hypothetical protein